MPPLTNAADKASGRPAERELRIKTTKGPDRLSSNGAVRHRLGRTNAGTGFPDDVTEIYGIPDGGPEFRCASRSQTTLVVPSAPGRSCRVMMVRT